MGIFPINVNYLIICNLLYNCSLFYSIFFMLVVMAPLSFQILITFFSLSSLSLLFFSCKDPAPAFIHIHYIFIIVFLFSFFIELYSSPPSLSPLFYSLTWSPYSQLIEEILSFSAYQTTSISFLIPIISFFWLLSFNLLFSSFYTFLR